MAKRGFFLGANSRTGFYPVFNSFTDSCRYLYVLKGGAGCGKSSFMHRVAKNMSEYGLRSELIYCSGDPDSLDGVLFPDIRTAIVDGTSPHIIEPKCPGFGRYIDLGSFCAEVSQTDAEMIMRLKEGNSNAYKSAYRFLKSAGELSDELRSYYDETIPCTVKRADGIARRVIGTGKRGTGQISDRFLDAITYDGVIMLDTDCEHIWQIAGEYGISSPMMDILSACAANAGYDVFRCRDPLTPNICRHVIIPELSLAFLTDCGEGDRKPERKIHVDALDCKKETKGEMKLVRRAYSDCLSIAVKKLGEAKRAHDEMERIVNPYVDFASAAGLADKLSEELKKTEK